MSIDNQLSENIPVAPFFQTSVMFDLCERYRRTILTKSETISTNITLIEPMKDDITNDTHLLWMLEEIKHRGTMKVIHLYQWLGFVQGVLISKGYLDSLGDNWLSDFTRPATHSNAD